MINVVYLVLVFQSSTGLTSQAIPQANMTQCEVNKKQISNRYSYCIVGVK